MTIMVIQKSFQTHLRMHFLAKILKGPYDSSKFLIYLRKNFDEKYVSFYTSHTLTLSDLPNVITFG